LLRVLSYCLCRRAMPMSVTMMMSTRSLRCFRLLRVLCLFISFHYSFYRRYADAAAVDAAYAARLLSMIRCHMMPTSSYLRYCYGCRRYHYRCAYAAAIIDAALRHDAAMLFAAIQRVMRDVRRARQRRDMMRVVARDCRAHRYLFSRH